MDSVMFMFSDCRDGEPLSEDVDVTGSDILIKGPVSLNLSGQYQCQASYYQHTAFLQFNVEVKPLLPGTKRPSYVFFWQTCFFSILYLFAVGFQIHFQIVLHVKSDFWTRDTFRFQGWQRGTLYILALTILKLLIHNQGTYFTFHTELQ